MFIVTNREIVKGGKGPRLLGPNPNQKGPNELRIVDANKSGGQWKLKVLRDDLTTSEKRALALPTNLDANRSQWVADVLLTRIRSGKKNFLFFVHGYNNDVEDVLERCDKMSALGDLEVVAFSWPANGGGLKGVTDYLADKRDARMSAGALDRALELTYRLLQSATQGERERLAREAKNKHPHNPEKQEAWIERATRKLCPFRLTLALHSMGNYVFKHMLKTSAAKGNNLLFDNVVMMAADVNSQHHEEWVDRVHFKTRLLVTINERDFALGVSRMKPGSEQLARLGHSTTGLNSRNATYVDFTGAPEVGRSHAYFEDALENRRIKAFFTSALNGEPAEETLGRNAYRSDINAWKV